LSQDGSTIVLFCPQPTGIRLRPGGRSPPTRFQRTPARLPSRPADGEAKVAPARCGSRRQTRASGGAPFFRVPKAPSPRSDLPPQSMGPAEVSTLSLEKAVGPADRRKRRRPVGVSFVPGLFLPAPWFRVFCVFCGPVKRQVQRSGTGGGCLHLRSNALFVGRSRFSFGWITGTRRTGNWG
jgi:hypothetical protein